MGKLKSLLVIGGTVIGSAIVYESALIGSRALASDIEYIGRKQDGPPQKKHWWSRTQSKKIEKKKGVRRK